MSNLSFHTSSHLLFRKIGISAFVLSSLLACSGTQAQTGGSANTNIEYAGPSPNGTGDCSARLQHALDSAGISGATVFLPAGTYRLARTIRLPAGVSLVGSGMGANAIKTPINGGFGGHRHAGHQQRNKGSHAL
jgi:Pectate lyase superfamily protein